MAKIGEYKVNEKQGRAYAKYVLKREMLKTGINAEKIAGKLNMDTNVLHTKISRASFSSGFFFQVINVLECKNIDLSDFEFFIDRLKKNEIKNDVT